jgi:hypothetical protein
MKRLSSYVSLLLGGCLALGIAPASAFGLEAPPPEGPPLTATRFSIEPVKDTVEEMVAGPQGLEPGFINEPYSPAFTQAGAHPWGLTTTIGFATKELLFEHSGVWPTREVKDIVVSLPSGFVGDPLAVPRCSLTAAVAEGTCPSASQVGVYRLEWFGGNEFIGPVADVVPERGQSAEFAFLNSFHISAVTTGHLVRVPASEGKPATYGLTVTSNGIPAVRLARIEVTFWGVPADPSHDLMRGLICRRVAEAALSCEATGGQKAGAPEVPFLTLGTDCTAGPQRAILRADSWEEPGRIGINGKYEGFTEAVTELPGAAGLTGCNLLSFDPAIETQPDTLMADEPVGANVNLKVPLNEAPKGLASANLRDARVSLPQGMSVNPGVVDGIRACEAEGPEGINIEGPLSERVGPSGELQLAPGDCPEASAVGTAEAITPLLSEPVKGHVFLARPGCGGAGQAACSERDVVDGNLYKLYLELGGEGELAQTGVHIKVDGRTLVNPATGQLTGVFEDNPQTPFSELKIHLNGGARSPLANPSRCGTAVTTADFTPWAAPGSTPDGGLVAGIGDATPSSFFEVQGCSSPQPFAPGMVAGTANAQAARFAPFTLDLSRRDREQYVRGVQLHTPPGLLAMLSSVPLCEVAQAETGTCPESARIGTTRVASGAGSHPFEIEGNVYLTGPYGGAPFGLSIVTHAVAGPFDLGLVVVRARISIDRHDSTATIAIDESGPHGLPQILFGVPLRLQRITARIDRPGFMFNPTSCGSGRHVEAAISGSAGTVFHASSPFATAGCRSLSFKPRFEAFTSGRTSRAKGASLDTRLSYPKGSFGKAANIARVKVDLPRQLPSRLATLQKACAAQTFEANPAACPSASRVGVVRATTPVLPTPLSGPVYFVSHGGEAFPSLVIVLQGDGVRVDLTGSTFISKGITSSTFKTVPDVPVGTFELYLPQGRFSALAAPEGLCKSKGRLKMPTELVAQNGLVTRQTTKITVTGCGKPKTRKAKTHKARTGKARASAGRHMSQRIVTVGRDERAGSR